MFAYTGLPAIILVALTLVASGCGGDNGDEGSTTPAPTTAAPTMAATTTPAPTSAPQPVCLGGGGFAGSGPLSDRTGQAGDGSSIAGIRWARHEGCERVVIDLVRADGSEAQSAGAVRAELRREDGIVRVYLDAAITTVGKTPAEMAEAAAPKYARLGGELAEQAFIVRSAEANRSLFIDVHLAAQAEARVLTVGSPARVVVDLKPGGGPVGAASEQLSGTQDPAGIVVITPKAGMASYPLRVTGYARTFEANVVSEVRQGGPSVAQVFGNSSDWLEAWGVFELVLLSGPAGPVDLFAGEYSPADGSEQGVHIALTMR